MTAPTVHAHPHRRAPTLTVCRKCMHAGSATEPAPFTNSSPGHSYHMYSSVSQYASLPTHVRSSSLTPTALGPPATEEASPTSGSPGMAVVYDLCKIIERQSQEIFTLRQPSVSGAPAMERAGELIKPHAYTSKRGEAAPDGNATAFSFPGQQSGANPYVGALPPGYMCGGMTPEVCSRAQRGN